MAVTITVEVEDEVLAKAVKVLDETCMTLEEGVVLLLRRLAEDGAVPPQLVTPNDPDYEEWVRAKVRQALDDPRPSVPHDLVMAEIDALIDDLDRARA